VPYSYWSVGGVLSLPSYGREPVGGNTTIVCGAWPVRRQTYGYLNSQLTLVPNLYCLVTVCPRLYYLQAVKFVKRYTL